MSVSDDRRSRGPGLAFLLGLAPDLAGHARPGTAGSPSLPNVPAVLFGRAVEPGRARTTTIGSLHETPAVRGGDAPSAESVARSVCGLVRTTTVLSRCDRGADEKWRRQSSEYGPVNAPRTSRESNEMRPLRYSINVTLDGCCHHEAGLPPDEESMRYWTAEMERADALLFGRVTYEMMESAWRQPATGTWPDWMNEWEIPFAETIDRAKKYVVSSTLSGVDWNAELVRGDLGQAVQRLKQEPGEGLFVGGVTLPLALADLGLIDEYEFLVQPVLAGHGPTLLAGLRERIQLELVDRHELRSGAVALRYRPTRVAA